MKKNIAGNVGSGGGDPTHRPGTDRGPGEKNVCCDFC